MDWYITAQIQEKWKKFPPLRQREFPFVHDPGYYRKAKPFLQEIDENWDIDYNLYHVTTNLSGVISSERLKSRRELGGTEGLGGGWLNVAPDSVSVTYDLSRARKIYDDLKFVCSVVRGQVTASEVLATVVDNSSGFDESRRFRNILQEFIPSDIVFKILNGELPESEIDAHITGGQNLYHFMQDLESSVSEYEISFQENSENLSDMVISVTGFTASYDNMLKINPNEIAILQLVAKKNANPEHIIGEMELRFESKDLKVIRFLKP